MFCLPAIAFLVVSLLQIIFDLMAQAYQAALIKGVFTAVFVILLNAICAGGYVIVAWVLVLVPLFAMSLITAIIIYLFGINLVSGNLHYGMGDPNNNNNSTKPHNTYFWGTNFSYLNTPPPIVNASTPPAQHNSNNNSNTYHKVSPYYQFWVV